MPLYNKTTEMLLSPIDSLPHCPICNASTIAFNRYIGIETGVGISEKPGIDRDQVVFACGARTDRGIKRKFKYEFPDNEYSVYELGRWKDIKGCGNAEEVVRQLREKTKEQ